jgi:hypothetical protein
MGTQGLENAKKVAYYEYDFDKDGGAIGAIALRPGSAIPAGAVITDAMVDVETAVTSLGAATIALHNKAANDIVTAVVLAGFTANTLIDGIPDGSIGNAIRTIVAGGVTLTIAVADLTAGKFVVAVEYYVTR